MHHAFFRCAPSVHMQVVYELHHFYMVSAILHSPGILYQQVEYSTAEDPDSDSPTPATPSYPQPVENCFAPSVFVHGKLEYECPHVSACTLHQDVSPHTLYRQQQEQIKIIRYDNL